MKIVLSLLATFCLTPSFAAEKQAFSGESEASVVIIDGLSKSETYGAKSKNTYTFENADNVSIFGKYLKTATQAKDASEKSETALNWEAGARYEKSLIESVNAFFQHKAESDPYNGVFTQRDSTDLGAKYFFIKTDATSLFTELGARYSTQNPDFKINNETKKSTTAGRVYVEGTHKFNESTAGKLWVEHVPNFADSRLNYSHGEASVSVAMSNALSLKTGYEVYYRNEGSKKTTTTWTTALVARY